jgi:biopolymer transport protein ExbB/TolQ
MESQKFRFSLFEAVNMVTEQKVMEAAVRSMEISVNQMRGQLKRRLNALATIGSTAPFVGLFGTVIGIVNAFTGINLQKGTGLAVVGPGIAEALVTTSLGLLVAVPSVWAYNYFTNKLELFDLEMDNSVDAMSTYLSGFLAAQRKH